MTKVTEVLDRAARQCSVTAPSSWITATSTTAKELRDDFLPETIDELQKRIDWSAPIGKQVVITGDDSENYALPANYVRLTNNETAVYETTTTRRAAIPVDSDGGWTHLKEIGTAGGSRYYRLKGYDGNYTIDFYRPPTTSDSITVSYISNVWLMSYVGSESEEGGGGEPVEASIFATANDEVLYPRRILELGIVWRFRKRKGLPYQDILAEYEAWIATTANRMRGRRTINFGETRRITSPFAIPVPDYIPSS